MLRRERAVRTRRFELERLEGRQLLAALRIGSLGDSLTDEYAFYGPDRTSAANWVEILAQSRAGQLTFGDFTTTTRGETRNQGYAQNWARSGARAQGTDVAGAGTTFVEQVQGGFAPGLPGLLTQPGGATNLDVVTILIGGNDYLAAIEKGVTNPSGIFNDLLQANAGILSTVQTTVPQLLASNPNLKIVLVTTPDIGLTAIVKDTLTLLPDADQQLVEGVLKSFTDTLTQSLTTYAQQQGLGLVNLDDLFTTFQANPVVDGVAINPNTGGADFTNFFVGDRFHPGTVAQAKLANAIVGQINTFFPNAITPLTDAEIVAIARAEQPAAQVTMTASAVGVAPGQPLTFTVQVATFPPVQGATGPQSFPVPTGFVTFLDAAAGNAILGVIPLDAQGKATLTTTALATGAHRITAVYGGDFIYPRATTPSATAVVGTPRQIRFARLLLAALDEGQQAVSLPQLNRWTRQLDRGVGPRALVRRILRQLSDDPPPLAQAGAARAGRGW